MIICLWYTHDPNFSSLPWFWGWMFLTWVYPLYLDLDIVTGLWYTHDLSFGSLPGFWRCKVHQCPLSPYFGLWSFASLSYFGYGHWSLINLCSEFWLYPDFEGTKNINVLWILIWGFGGHFRFLTGVWHLGHDLDGLSYLAWNFPEVFNSLRLVKAKIELV